MSQPQDYFHSMYNQQHLPYPPPPTHSSSSRLTIDTTSSVVGPNTYSVLTPSGFVQPVPATPAHSEPNRSRTSSTSDKPTRPPLSTNDSGSSTRRKTSETGDSGEPVAATPDVNGASAPKVKRTRQRKPASCAQCRKKKLRCNRADPCDQCTAKGQGNLCSWDGAEPLYSRRNEADTQELRDQVARLESLVRYLTSQRRDEEAIESSLPAGADSPSSPNVVSFPSKTARQGSSSSQTNPDTAKSSSYAMDLRANDLCEGIAQLAIKEFVVVEGSGNDSWAPGNQRGLEFIDEARLFLKTMPQQFGVAETPVFSYPSRASSTGARSRMPSDGQSRPPSDPVPQSPTGSTFSTSSRASMVSPSPLGTASFGRDAPPLSDVLKFLPTRKQAHSAYTYFVGYVDWYAHPVHLSTFEAQWKVLDDALQLPDEEARLRAIDPFFIATALGIWATGLAMMPVKRAMRDGFPEDKDRIVDQWLEGAMVALTCGRFLDNPSVESVRATVVLSTFFVFTATGERSGAGMGLLSLVVQIALSLGLQRDPDRTPGRFTFFEAEERRRLFWNLFMLCILSSASLSRTWAVFDLNNVDTKLPLDCHDHEILDESLAKAGIEKRRTKFEETPMTSLIVKMKLAVLARKMNDRAFGIHPVSYEEVLALDAELREFEEAIPARYRLRLDPSGALIRPATHVTVTEMRACMIMISLAGEYIRLHRPWLLLSSQNKAFQQSRDQAIKYSKLLLAVYRSPSCNKQKWGGLSYKATNAAIVLAIDILAFPEQSEVDSLRSMVKAVQKQMEAQAPHSSLCRKGSRLINFLLDKDAALSAARDQRRQQKRSRVDVSDVAAFPSRSLRNVFDSTLIGQPSFLHERDDEPLHHKTDFSPTASDDYSVSSSSLLPRQIAPPPSHADFRAPPPPAAAQSTNSLVEGVNFAEFAGAFDFDFSLPNQPFPSPAPTLDSSSPYMYPPSYLAAPPQYPMSQPGIPPPSIASYNIDHKTVPNYPSTTSFQPYYR